MTNLITAAIIVLSVTNVTTTSNERGCSTCDGIRKNHWLLYHDCDKKLEPYSPATERTITTQVDEVKMLDLRDGSKPFEISRNPISTRRRKDTLKTEWVIGVDAPVTNDPSMTLIFVTNRYSSEIIGIIAPPGRP